jgi:hypothetical protein
MTRTRRSRKHPPKGSYPHPAGGYVTERIGPPDAHGRRIAIRVIHHPKPDAKMLARAFIELARIELEKKRRDSGDT